MKVKEPYRPKCHNCGNRFVPRYSTTEKYCKEPECSKVWIQLEKKKQLKKELKEFSKRKSKIKPLTHTSEYKTTFQQLINRLARLIDGKFGNITCIDCGKPFKKIDAGHFHSVGSNSSLRYNLHNIHSQAYECNRNGIGGGKQLGFYKGLIRRYGQEYADLVDTELGKKYYYVGLKANDYPEKIKLVRALIREFDTYKFKDSLHARELCNKIIGIYDEILFR